MKKPLISIIIPAYNVEPYLLRCLDSIDSQSYENFECIIIIDGSTDKTYDIAKNYCLNHPRFKVYYQDNAGSGSARNNGIAHSTGVLICFIDPDDWVEPDYLESMITEQQKGNYDLVISQSISRKINSKDEIVSTSYNKKPLLSYFSKFDCRENFPDIMFVHHYLDGPICKLYRASIIRNNHVVFPDYRRSQDMVFNFRYFNHITSFSTISQCTYNIRYEYPPRPGRGRNFTNYHEIVSKIFYELSKQLESWGLTKEYHEKFYSWAFWYVYASIIQNVIACHPFNYIQQEPFKTIINQARPKLTVQKLIRYLLSKKMYKLAAKLILCIQNYKNSY